MSTSAVGSRDPKEIMFKSQVQQVIATIADETVPVQERLKRTAEVLSSAVNYADLNEKRANLQEKEIEDLNKKNKKLKSDLSSQEDATRKIEKTNEELKQHLDEQKVLQEREEFINRNSSSGPAAVIGTISGIAVSCLAFPIVGLAVGLSAGLGSEKLFDAMERGKTEHYLKYYEDLFLSMKPKATKRQAFEYAKEHVLLDEKNLAEKYARESDDASYGY